MQKYARGLKSLRESAGLSQRQLALRAGIDPSYVCHLEAGTREPSLTAIEKLSAALSIPPGVFLLACGDQGDLVGMSPAQGRQIAKLLQELMLEAGIGQSAR